MSDLRTRYFVVLMSVAGVASALVSVFGIFVGLWGGFGRTVEEVCLWLFPTMSFPAFIVALKFRRIALVISALILLGTFAVICAGSFQSCAKGDCINPNPFSIIAAVISKMIGCWMVLSVSPLCFYFAEIVRQTRDPVCE